jgi:predicted membrane channel-forming protein YqfA (hemolysin III family)
MFTYVILFLILATITGVLSVTMESPVPSILFGVSLALFLGAGFAYMRERYRGSRP